MARYVYLIITISCLLNCQKATDSLYEEFLIVAPENDSLYKSLRLKLPNDEKIAFLRISIDSLATTVQNTTFSLDSIEDLRSLFHERQIVRTYLRDKEVIRNLKHHLARANKALRTNSLDSSNFIDIRFTNSDTTRIDNLPLPLLKSLLSGLLAEVKLAERKALIEKISYDTIPD